MRQERRWIFCVLVAMLLTCVFSGAANAETVDERLEKMDQTIQQLQELVIQQNQKIEQQDETIKELREEIGLPAESPEEMARSVEPHLDKHILHERSGLGEQLGNVTVGIGLTGIVQGSIDAEDVSGERDDQTDANWSMDLELEAPIGENGLGFVLIEAGQGEGLTDELAVFHNVNDDAGDSESGLEVTEAWYEHYFCDERVTLTVGKIDLTNYVDGNSVANDETAQFLNTGLVNSLAVEFPEDNGAGVRVGVYPNDWLEFNVGWAESDADWEDIVNDSFAIAEANIMPGLLYRDGNYRFYVWTNGSDKAELDGTDDDESGWGCGISFDQELTDCLTAFARAGWADADVYEVEGNWSAGLQVSGQKWSRENDVIGFAVSQALINDDLVDDDTETLFEAYYSYAVNSQLAISPDLQIIDNPGGNSHNDTIIALGMRAQLNF